jgi:hypothetical protein
MKRFISCVVLVSLMVTPALFADGTQGRLDRGSFYFEKNGAVATFSRESGLRITVGDKTMNMIRVGDDNAGQFVVTTDDSTVTVGYRMVNGQLQIDGADPTAAFYASLRTGDDTNLASLDRFAREFARASRETVERKGPRGPNAEMSDCAEYQAWAVATFAGCPGSFGLGCLAGGFFLYKMAQAC